MSTPVPGRPAAPVPPRRLVEVPPPPARALDVVESKLRIPAARPGAVSRTALVNRLRAARTAPLGTVVAPAGYGKTTLLAQWAARDERPFAWVTLDERDGDPVTLLRHVAAALDRIEPLERTLLDALHAPGESIWTTLLPRLARALGAVAQPFVAVLDETHLLTPGDATAAIAVLAEHVPAGSQLALAGRTPPELPIAKLRAAGRLHELTLDDLALTPREAELLLRGTAIELPEADREELIRRSEGWPAGLHLAALACATSNGRAARRPPARGDDRYLAEYFRAEYLDRVSEERLAFLRRTSVLEALSAPLCDAVLDRRGSALELEALERSNLFLVPLDRHGEWFRYHPLFRDLLCRELAEHEATLLPTLHARAADWLEAHGDAEAALEHAHALGDVDRAERILIALALPAYYGGRVTTVERWLERFERETELDRHPRVAVHGARVHAMRGRPDEAERWLDAAERDADALAPDAAPRIAVVRAALCRDGAEQMAADAGAALSGLPAKSQWRPTALLLEGVGRLLLGDGERADTILAAAADEARRHGWTETQSVAVAERALLATARGELARADELALGAQALVERGDVVRFLNAALPLAVSARAALRQGRWDDARSRLTLAAETSGALTRALPWLAVQTRLELARAYISLRDGRRAAAEVDEAEAILRVRPLLGPLAGESAALRAELDALLETAGEDRGAGLTPAELRLLPLLATHLSFREIGERLYVSRNTIKTEAISVYRKLGVSSRTDAIDRAAGLGLLDAAASV